MNYTILVVPGALILLWIYWHVSVKNWFTGPEEHASTCPAQVSSAEEIEREHHGETFHDPDGVAPA